jgi:LPXTG-motif cell wall-anchored protein
MPISLATIVSFILLAAFGPALAQTTAPSPAPAATGDFGDYWWLIVLVLLLAVAAWYFKRRRTTTRL